MDYSLRQLCDSLKEKHAAACSGRADSREDFVQACIHDLPTLLDALETACGRTPLGISPHALTNVNFFLWIAMRIVNYLSIVLIFSVWMFTQAYSGLSMPQTVCTILFFIVQVIVTFPESIMYERKEFETVRRTRSAIARFSISVIMIGVAIFQFAMLGYAVTH